jgi:hypothetical protein
LISPALSSDYDRSVRELIASARSTVDDLMTQRVWFDACTTVPNVPPPGPNAIQSTTEGVPCETENEKVRTDTEWVQTSLTEYIDKVHQILLKTPYDLKKFSAKSTKKVAIEMVELYATGLFSRLAIRAARANRGKDLEHQPTYFNESNFLVRFAADAKTLINKSKKSNT